MFEIFRFNSSAYYLMSLILHALACLIMRSCLIRAFPTHVAAANASMLLAFVLPPLSNLTYMIHTDNSRISMIFYWISILRFQRWASTSASWTGLMFPVLMYCLSVLSYENTSLLIFAVPLFVLPAYWTGKKPLGLFGFMGRTIVAIVTGFIVFMGLRFLVFSGGAVSHASIVPSTETFSLYLGTLIGFLGAPFYNVSGDLGSWAWGLLVAAVGCALIFPALHSTPQREGLDGGFREHGHPYALIMGAAVFVLGTLPYLIAGYDASPGFTSQSRIYSSGAFGIAIILGSILGYPWGSRILRWGVSATGVVAMILMAVFFADLRTGWQQAAQERSALCESLISQVPSVTHRTTFLFLDLQCYVSDRAVVFQGVDGLPEFVRILYGDRSLKAYFLYPFGVVGPDEEGKTAVVCSEGILARGAALNGPSPLDSLIILKRNGPALILLEEISATEQKAAIRWNGISEIRTNKDRIAVDANHSREPAKEICQ